MGCCVNLTNVHNKTENEVRARQGCLALVLHKSTSLIKWVFSDKKNVSAEDHSQSGKEIYDG